MHSYGLGEQIDGDSTLHTIRFASFRNPGFDARLTHEQGCAPVHASEGDDGGGLPPSSTRLKNLEKQAD
jgi:hypothetical protein